MTDHFAGFRITGRFRAAELVQLIAALPEGLTELMCHPGRCTDELRSARTRLKESRERELEALVASETREALRRHGVELASSLCGREDSTTFTGQAGPLAEETRGPRITRT